MSTRMNIENSLQTRLEEDKKVVKLVVITFTKFWNVIIGVQSYITTILVTYVLAFSDYNPGIETFIILSDLFFLIDFIATIIYNNHAKLRRFMHYKPRNWKLVAIDLATLLPLSFAYETYTAQTQQTEFMHSALQLNRCLRLYRVFVLLNAYDLTIRYSVHYVFMMFFRFFAQVVLISHILACIWANVEKSEECRGTYWFCVLWHEQHMLLIVIHHWRELGNIMLNNGERALVIVGMVAGMVVIYGHFIPYTLHIFMRVSQQQGTNYKKYLIVQRYLKNITVGANLEEKVRKYFKYFWHSGTMEMEMEVLTKDLPLVLQKEIFTDIYWDALRHSDFFRFVSRNFKRSLSLYMTTEYCQEGDIIFYKGRRTQKMIYLVRGVIELMAEENSNSPIMSFSGGTILGEMSLFIMHKTQAIVRCRTLCELQTVSLRNVANVLMSYPKDKKIIFQNVNRRLVIAKITQWRKKELSQEKNVDMSMGGQDQLSLEDNEDCIKWVKEQWRAIWEAHERHQLVLKSTEKGIRVPTWRRQRHIRSRLDAVSNYMDLMVLSDVFEEKKDVVCLKTVFPWAIDPDSEFFRYWKFFIVLVSLVPSLVYPFCAGWLTQFPPAVYNLSFICTLVFQIDLALTLMTAIKTKHGIVTKFLSIMINSLKKPTFYMDVLAALPLQIYVSSLELSSATEVGLFLLPGILKSHVYLKPRTKLGNSMVFISIVKNISIFLLFMYWCAAIFQLMFIRCVAGCGYFHWREEQEFSGNSEFIRENFLSLFVAVAFSLSIPDYVVAAENEAFLLIIFTAKLFFFFISCFFIGDFYVAYSIKTSNKLKFKNLHNRIAKYLDEKHVSPILEKRLLRIIRFQWEYNEGDDLLTKVPVIKLAPQTLRRQIFIDSLFDTFRKCPLLKEESTELIFDLMEKCRVTAVPSGTILVNYGLQCYRVHMIHKGFCQINSFLDKDVAGGLGAAILTQPGDLFPTLAAFITAPVPISVLTVTDCEVVMIALEDLLKTFIAHDVFRDLVDVLYTNNYLEKLSQHRLAMIRLNVNFNVSADDSEYEEPFRKFGKFGRIIKKIIVPKSMFYDNTQQQKWFLKILQHIYFVYILIGVIMWPLAFGVLVLESHYLIPILISLDIYVPVYVYMRIHMPYYDTNGLLITHPFRTFIHYLTTSFLVDTIVNFPLYTIYRYTIRNPYEKDNSVIVLIQAVQKFTSLIVINGFINNFTSDSNYVSFFRALKFLVLLFVILNSITNYDLFLISDWVIDEPYRVIESVVSEKHFINRCYYIPDTSILHFYMIITYWMFGHFTTTIGQCRKEFWEEKLYSTAPDTIGTLATFIFFGWLAAQSAIGDGVATIYQERMKSFIHFMLNQKMDDKIVEAAINYFEHQWSRTQGQDLSQIFGQLPYYVHEELAYPLYRPTLLRTGLFNNFDEGIYKLLSTNLNLVHFNRGSIIIFKGQITSDIFFVHSGKCFVFDWFQTLDVGSMIGDLKNTGVMQTKVMALTHVELLQMTADNFFSIINVFHDIEKNYLSLAGSSENFIKSAFVPLGNQLRPVDSRDVLNAFNLQSKDLGFEDQSYFEDPENISSQYPYMSSNISNRKFSFMIYPGTNAKTVYNIVVQSVAFATILILPALFFYGSLTWQAFVIVNSLDFLWFLAIIVTFRVGIEDKIKGDIITEWKLIAKNFILRADGFFLSIMTCIPTELIPVFIESNVADVNRQLVNWLRVPRLFRCYYLIKYLNTELRKLKVSFIVRALSIIIQITCYTNFLVLIYLLLATNTIIVDPMDALEFKQSQITALLITYEYVINLITSANAILLMPESRMQILYFDLVSITSIYIKALVIKNILSILFINGLARSKYKRQVASLETYLKIHDLSPSILKEVLNYKLKLLIVTRSENMPTFLLSAPASIQLPIMCDLYLHHLLKGQLFRDVDINFLRLLVCRLERVIFFPGQKIVEKGDVDYNMYFIHKGEVYVIDNTDEDAYVEYIVDRLYTGDQFGEAQGLYIACQHKFTYRARTLVEILILNSSSWKNLRRVHMKAHKRILEQAKNLQLT